ncbi:hypothetical protein [Mastigocoleus sp. MO_188.B34]|uniref:hypothetical protein n=1 Tax=Mastigocoleus sp. MO_188.B34 TaxID=3036635 RepID=UPI002606BBA7|nr:hypothetical protein [Mastigocoleus sp. MO_188.B34]MDJ0692888.1 hypothetical protein [Mastigocoleus sp. MO_188.B34]
MATPVANPQCPVAIWLTPRYANAVRRGLTPVTNPPKTANTTYELRFTPMAAGINSHTLDRVNAKYFEPANSL